jgi:hypothetical protein
VFDSVAAAGNAIDVYYEFDLSATTGATAVGATWDGYLAGAVNTLKVYAYNWGGSSWDQVGNVVGIAGTMVGAQEFELTNAHTGTGGNLGKARIRFAGTGLTTGTLKTDRILLGYAVVVVPPANFSSLVISGTGVADARLADGVAHGGTPGSSTASFAMQSMNVTNPTGDDAVHFESTGAGGAGFAAIGAGASPGASFAGGTNGSGLTLIAAGGGAGLNVLVAGSGDGIRVSPDTGTGFVIQSGGFSISGSLSIVNSTGSHAVIVSATAGNTSGISVSGHGTGAGITTTGGATNGPGFSCIGQGSAPGIRGVGGNSGGAGIFGLGDDGPGMRLESSTGDGLKIYSDGGYGIVLTAPSGYGFDGTLSPDTLASFVVTDSGKVAADIAAGSVVYLVLSQTVAGTFPAGSAGYKIGHSIAGFGV